MLILAGGVLFYFNRAGRLNNITGVLNLRMEEQNTGETKEKDERKLLDITAIDHIVIKNHSGESDSTKTITKQLPPNHAKLFADKWNSSKSKGPCVYLPAYNLDIFFKDGTQRSFKANGQSVKENADLCFDIGETDYFNKLWAELK